MLILLTPVYAHAEEGASAPSCIKLTRIDWAEREFSDEELRARVRPHIGKCIDKALLNALTDEISNVYMSRGNVTTRAYLLEQDVADGQIEITVIRGVVEDIVDGKSKKSNFRTRSAFAFQKGKLLNLRHIESSLEMMNRTPTSQVKFDITPGTNYGESLIEIKTIEERFPLYAQVGFSGHHNLMKDNVSLTASISMDNLLNINDILTYQYNSSYVQKEYQGNAGSEWNYSFPVADYLFEFVSSNFTYKQGVSGVNATYLSNGKTLATRLRTSKVLSRNQTDKLTGAFSIYHKGTKNYFAGELIDISSYKTTLAQLDFRYTHATEWGQIAGVYSFYRGLDWFGARADSYIRPDNGTASDAKLQFRKHTLDLNLYYRVKDTRYSASSNWHTQYAEDRLYNNDQLSVGSDYTVRGYLNRNLFGGNAWYLNNNLTASWNPDVWGARNISTYFGYDYGQVKCEVDSLLSCGDVAGIALGLDINSEHLATSFVLSQPQKAIGENFKKEVLFKFDITGKL